MIIADRKQRLFVSAAFYFSEKIGEFLGGSQLRRLVCFSERAQSRFCLQAALPVAGNHGKHLPPAIAAFSARLNRILTNRQHAASKARRERAGSVSIMLFTGIFCLTNELPTGNV